MKPRLRAIRRLPVVLLLATRCSGPCTIALNASLAPVERQLTSGPGGRILCNTGVWSPDSQSVVYDTRSDSEGAVFDGKTIQMVNVVTGEVKEVYRARHGARCGVVTFHPREWKVVFILGPEHPTDEWQYCAWHRRGVIVEVRQPGRKVNLDARDLVPPFTPGALRGGSHVHLWDAAGEWVSFTYEDDLLARLSAPTPTNDINQRNVGVSVPGIPVRVRHAHPRNHDGEYFTALTTRTVAEPQPGSDEIQRAYEESWVGTNGYVRQDGVGQRHALAFQGQVLTRSSRPVSEVLIVDLPNDPTKPGLGPLCGTATRAPCPPQGTHQRRLTYTADRKFPGIQGPRHWLRSSPDGSQIAFLMKDNAGGAQLWAVSPNGSTFRPRIWPRFRSGGC